MSAILNTGEGVWGFPRKNARVDGWNEVWEHRDDGYRWARLFVRYERWSPEGLLLLVRPEQESTWRWCVRGREEMRVLAFCLVSELSAVQAMRAAERAVEQVNIFSWSMSS